MKSKAYALCLFKERDLYMHRCHAPLLRTHFFDGVRYVVYFVNGRLIHPDKDEVRGNMGGAEVETKNTFRGEPDKADHLKAYLNRRT